MDALLEGEAYKEPFTPSWSLPIPIFFSLLTVLIKSTEGLAFLRDPTDTILLYPQHYSCCLCLLL